MHTWYVLTTHLYPTLLILDVDSYFYLIQNYFTPLALEDGVWYAIFA